MSYQNVFERYEIKYLITREQLSLLQAAMQQYMQPDQFYHSTICNIYFDTPDRRMIRRSIEGPIYKEKLRVRSYGAATPDSMVFVELKKKFRSVVYKRRIDMPETAAMHCLRGSQPIGEPTQIAHEIDYCRLMYGVLEPAVFISYERDAFCANDGSDFRVTFDENIMWRNYDLSLCRGIYGNRLLAHNQLLMEVKTASAIPLWMSHLLSDNQIYKTSFSKYGNAFKAMSRIRYLGGVRSA